jgi:hypothetical protein
MGLVWLLESQFYQYAESLPCSLEQNHCC